MHYTLTISLTIMTEKAVNFIDIFMPLKVVLGLLMTNGNNTVDEDHTGLCTIYNIPCTDVNDLTVNDLTR